MRYLLTLFFAILLSATVSAEPVQLEVNELPGTHHQLRIDSDDIPTYVKLADEIGLDYDWVYGYNQFAIAKEENNIATGAVSGGPYEFLLLSTGGSSNNPDDDIRAQRSPLHWEMLYLGNYDVTVIWSVKHDGDSSFVKLMKLGRGRIPDLHLH